MKKLLFAFVFVLATFATAQAQSGLGIRGGANLSNLDGDLQDESLYENKWGFHAGLVYNIAIVEDFFSIQPELLYSTKGFKNADEEYTVQNQPGVTFRREGNANYNYIDLPVLAKITAGPVYFEAGPQASYLLSVNDETRAYQNGTLLTTSRTEIDKDNLRQFELGYAAGVGFTTGERFNLGVRYNGSFSDFVNETPDDYFNEDIRNARNSVIMLTAAVFFTR